MLVYGSLVVDGMVLSGYDSGFQPSLAFFSMPWYVAMFISVFELWFAGRISEFEVEVVSRLIPKGLGIPWLVLVGYTVKLEGKVSV